MSEPTCAFEPERPRAETVVRLRKSCTRAQGFCQTALVLVVLAALVMGTTTANFFRGENDLINPGSLIDMPNGAYLVRLGVAADEVTFTGPDGEQFTMSRNRAVWLGYGEGGTIADEWEWARLLNGQFTEEREALSPVELLFTSVGRQVPVIGFVEGWADVIFAGVLFGLGARFFRLCASREGPFRPACVRALSRIALTVALFAVAPGLAALAVLQIGLSVGIASGEYTLYLVNVVLVLAAILLFALAKAFEYGCVLQTQDDGLV